MNVSEKSLCQIKNWMNLVKDLRKQYGLSQKEMARLLKISVNTLRKIEKGEIPLKMKIHPIWCVYKVFGILPKDQFRNEED